MSLYLWVFLGTSPIGSLLFGAVEQAWGSRVALAIGGAAAVLAALGGTWWWRRVSRSRQGYASGLVSSGSIEAPRA